MSLLTASTIDLEDIPYKSISAGPGPDLGISRTASLMTSKVLLSSISAEITASPRPPVNKYRVFSWKNELLTHFIIIYNCDYKLLIYVSMRMLLGLV